MTKILLELLVAIIANIVSGIILQVVSNWLNRNSK